MTEKHTESQLMPPVENDVNPDIKCLEEKFGLEPEVIEDMVANMSSVRGLGRAGAVQCLMGGYDFTAGMDDFACRFANPENPYNDD